MALFVNGIAAGRKRQNVSSPQFRVARPSGTIEYRRKIFGQ
jgi:hypothetical protein